MLPVLEALDFFYLSMSPYDISIANREEKGWQDKKELTYGETFLLSIPKIFQNIEITEKDVFYELGSGSGYLSFFVNQYYPAKKVIGIDIIGDFIKICNIVIKNLKLNNIYFYEDNYLDKNIDDGTIFYITATCYASEEMALLEKKLNSLPAGIKVIMISRPLNSPDFILTKYKFLEFSWNFDSVFFYKKI